MTPTLALLAQAGSEALRSVLLDLPHPPGSKGQGLGPRRGLSLALDFQPGDLRTLSPDLRGRGLIGTLTARGQRGFWEASGDPGGFWEALSTSRSLAWEAACDTLGVRLWGVHRGGWGWGRPSVRWQRRGPSPLRGDGKDPMWLGQRLSPICQSAAGSAQPGAPRTAAPSGRKGAPGAPPCCATCPIPASASPAGLCPQDGRAGAVMRQQVP